MYPGRPLGVIEFAPFIDICHNKLDDFHDVLNVVYEFNNDNKDFDLSFFNNRLIFIQTLLQLHIYFDLVEKNEELWDYLLVNHYRPRLVSNLTEELVKYYRRDLDDEEEARYYSRLALLENPKMNSIRKKLFARALFSMFPSVELSEREKFYDGLVRDYRKRYPDSGIDFDSIKSKYLEPFKGQN